MDESKSNQKPETLVPSLPSGIGGPNGSDGSGSVASSLRGSQDTIPATMESRSPSPGWTRVRHPDSGVYYINEEGVCTTSNVHDSGTRSLITRGIEMLQSSPALEVLRKNQKIGLVLDVQRNANGTRTSYYCVSHVERRVFWLHGIGHDDMNVRCSSKKCVKSQGSGLHCIEAEYWKHCELFPTTFTVTTDVTSELKDVLLQAAADRLLVKFSTSPYDKHDLEYMLNVVKEIEEGVSKGSSSCAAWIIARFMTLHNDGVLQSLYGQDDDYFDIEGTGRKIGPYKRSKLLAVIAPFFLMTPDVYAVELHSLHESFTHAGWSDFVHKVDQSIRDSNLLATVLLGTNVGFLAWADGGKNDGINSPTAAQIVTYISILCAVGSIIIGLAIFKQYRAKRADTPLRAAVILRHLLRVSYGLERLAIICSLPYVLLMWGLIAFLGAFGIVFYDDTDIQVLIPVSICLFLIILCLLFCWHTAMLPEKLGQKTRGNSAEAEPLLYSGSEDVEKAIG